ncbi:MAG TPA: M1 family aminopeptidase [Gemmatimonadales bacterium]|nr:M1 family aminopeptidase [Gemmatimonadales bacterium]
MSTRVCIWLAALTAAAGSAARPALAQRPTGVIGAYVPPRDWPEEPRRFDLLHQKIEIRFDVPHRELFGAVTTRVAITLAPTDTVRLNAENLTIDAATDARGRALRFAQDTAHVTVRLARRAAVGDTVEFVLKYHGIPERGLYFVPRKNVIWSQGEATETRAWVPTYDAPNDKTTWEFLVTVDSSLKVLSNGHLAEVTPVKGTAQKTWHWVEDRPASTYLYSVVAGPFTILHDEWRGRPVDYWTYPDTVNAAWRTFGETPAMIELYSEVLGVNFAWDKYDQSIIPDFTYGGMENVSATTQTDLALHPEADEPDNDGRGLNAHELAHQWFGDLTTTASWAHIWLNEGITTYMESVQEEKTRGWDAAELNWYGQQQQAMQADQNEVRALVWGTYQGTDPIALFFSGHVYPKGAQLAHQLRRLLGDSLFWAGMHRFLVDNAYKPVTTADYAIAMEKTCNCDLDWFFDQWAYGIGYPQVHFTRHWAPQLKTLHVVVSETQPIDSLHPFFRFPATIRVITRDSVVRHQIVVTHPVDTFAIPLPSEPLSFRFDEGGWLLGTVTGDLSEPELAQMAKHDLDIRGRRWALGQLQASGDSIAADTRRFVALNEHSEWLREVAVRQMARDSGPESRSVLRAALRDPEPDVRAQALRSLSALDSAGAVPLATAMYATDPASAVRMAALVVLGQRTGAAAIPTLVAATAPDQPRSIRGMGAAMLGHVPRDPRGADALERLTANTEDRDLRTTALQSLVQVGDSARATAVALRDLGDYDPLFAVAAVQVVGQVGGAAGKAKLADALKAETRVTVRLAIERALAGK